MSHNDYTKYARENRVEIPETPVVEVPVEEPVAVEAPIEEPVVVEAPVEEPEIIEAPTEPEVEPSNKMGRVFGCSRLNIRRAPKPRAEVICEIDCDTEVEIDEAGSTVDFYKIFTASGIEGYCVKTYISVAK